MSCRCSERAGEREREREKDAVFTDRRLMAGNSLSLVDGNDRIDVHMLQMHNIRPPLLLAAAWTA